MDAERAVRIEQDVKYLVKELDELKEKLFGNGQPGIIEKQDKRISDLEKITYRALGALGLGLLIINLVGIFLGKK